MNKENRTIINTEQRKNTMSLLGNIFGAFDPNQSPQSSARHPYLNIEGIFDVKIRDIRLHSGRGGNNLIFIEYEISSIHKKVGDIPLEKGKVFTWCLKIPQPGGKPEFLEMFQRDFQRFFAACLGLNIRKAEDEEEARGIGEEVLEDACDELKPFSGRILSLETVNKEMKNNPGEFFTNHYWDLSAEDRDETEDDPKDSE